jgi:hypothetical protein
MSHTPVEVRDRRAAQGAHEKARLALAIKEHVDQAPALKAPSLASFSPEVWTEIPRRRAGQQLDRRRRGPGRHAGPRAGPAPRPCPPSAAPTSTAPGSPTRPSTDSASATPRRQRLGHALDRWPTLRPREAGWPGRSRDHHPRLAQAPGLTTPGSPADTDGIQAWQQIQPPALAYARISDEASVPGPAAPWRTPGQGLRWSTSRSRTGERRSYQEEANGPHKPPIREVTPTHR